MVDAKKFKQLKSTFPWSYRIDKTKSGGLIRVSDNTGAEVDLLQLIEFIVFITVYLRDKNEQREDR